MGLGEFMFIVWTDTMGYVYFEVYRVIHGVL